MSPPRVTFPTGWNRMMDTWTTGTYEGLLLDSGWTPDPSSDVFVADVTAFEVAGAGYGRATITTPTRAPILPPTVTGIGYVTFDCDDVDFGTPAGGANPIWFAFYALVTTDADSPLVAAFAIDVTFTGSAVVIGVSPNGIMRDASVCPNDFG